MDNKQSEKRLVNFKELNWQLSTWKTDRESLLYSFGNKIVKLLEAGWGGGTNSRIRERNVYF